MGRYYNGLRARHNRGAQMNKAPPL